MQLYCHVIDPGVLSKIRKVCICDTTAVSTAQINYGDLMLLLPTRYFQIFLENTLTGRWVTGHVQQFASTF